MIVTLNFASLLGATNVQAALRVIRHGETWNSDNPGDERDEAAFRVRYHPTIYPCYFDSFADHPRILEPLKDGSGRKSSAAGAYQETMTTWDDMRGRYPGFGPSFKPWDQMACAVALIYDCGALDDVIDGNLAEFIRKCGGRWASLPNSSLHDGGRKMSMADAEAVWKRFGGGVDHVISSKPREPAPVEDRSTQARPEDVERINATEEPMAFPVLPLVLPLLQSLIEGFSSIGRAKATEALTKKGLDPTTAGGIADSLLGIVKSLAAQGIGVTVGPAGVQPAVPPQPTAAVDPIIAIATVKSNPQLLAEAEQQFLDYFDKLAPLFTMAEKLEQGAWAASEESANAAAARAAARPPESWDMTRTLVWGMLAMMGFLLLFVAGVAGWQTYVNSTPSTEVWAAVTGLIGFGTGVAVTVYAFRFGYSRQSGAKDALLSELATRRTN